MQKNCCTQITITHFYFENVYEFKYNSWSTVYCVNIEVFHWNIGNGLGILKRLVSGLAVTYNSMTSWLYHSLQQWKAIYC